MNLNDFAHFSRWFFGISEKIKIDIMYSLHSVDDSFTRCFVIDKKVIILEIIYQFFVLLLVTI